MKTQKKIGILGGGQLARMSAYQAYKLGFNVAILEKEKNSPAGQLTHNEFVGSIENDKLLKEFVDKSDIFTLENEFIDADRLKFIESLGKKVIPSSNTIRLIQDKYIQKKTLAKHNIPHPKFIEVKSEIDYQKISAVLGKRFIVKSRKMGYDGYGNADVKNESDFKDAFKKLTTRHVNLYAEEFIKFKKELAVMVVRTKREIKTYPVVETIQKNHICHTVIAPAQISKRKLKEAEKIGIDCVKAVKGFGLFGIEMFIDEKDKILVNEMAPRPHNSGHYTIEGCVTSQFENHIRSVLSLPLGSTDLVKKYAVMVNLLGKRDGKGVVQNYQESLSEPDLHLHIYGKANSRIGRKMGHITIIGDKLNTILHKAKQMEKRVII
ncbi:MAG: 5-(carboxyamino)imidazole ribonucleotide synthase [Melioribacteraceae bacterium]|nr:5-(carboxyamino)imidazole ribonucleotide synthase [Melioribacteraceae bacterium]